MKQLGLEIEPTVAIRRGAAWIDQCSRCGLLAAVPSGSEVAKTASPES